MTTTGEAQLCSSLFRFPCLCSAYVFGWILPPVLFWATFVFSALIFSFSANVSFFISNICFQCKTVFTVSLSWPHHFSNYLPGCCVIYLIMLLQSVAGGIRKIGEPSKQLRNASDHTEVRFASLCRVVMDVTSRGCYLSVTSVTSHTNNVKCKICFLLLLYYSGFDTKNHISINISSP